jgi:hypothetical protein
MRPGRPRGPRPTALPIELATAADHQARYWTAVGTIGRALQNISCTERVHLLRVLLDELAPAEMRPKTKRSKERGE